MGGKGKEERGKVKGERLKCLRHGEDEDEDAPAVRLIATLSLVNAAGPRLIVAGRQVKMPAAW